MEALIITASIVSIIFVFNLFYKVSFIIKSRR
ncbi:hypothetical protein C8E03_108148 [Lachnotalea glycerini]|uniref:Uncharacterized protein n=1 Tax=Lachnotalea glycerini TaxID=1763509 RepID=A0A318EK10_9FIRM|nr:hypothetical protein C8E03_108148 [Lachnotalea glycerini]